MKLDGFYAILDRDDEALARILVGASHILQLRLKDATAAETLRVARMALRVCREAGASFVMNDRLDLALACGADAVHLGQTDLPLAEARALAGGRLAIGVSTHDLAQVRAACEGGADYLGFGPVFATQTKANPDPVRGLALLREAVALAGTRPVVAIGGITPALAAEVYATGVAAICAMGSVNQAVAPALAAAAMGRISAG